MRRFIRLNRWERLFVLLIVTALAYAVSAVQPEQPAKPVVILDVATTSAVMEEAVVRRVIDGDTIELADGRVVRYIGIDTPEISRSARVIDPAKGGADCFGKEAKEENARLVGNKTVRLEKDVSEVDRYGRLLRYVYVGDIMVNDALVRGGFAHVSTFPPDVMYVELFIAAQREAERLAIGLWSKCATINTGTN